MDVLSTFQWSNKDSDHSVRRNKPVHFGGSLDFLYCIKTVRNKIFETSYVTISHNYFKFLYIYIATI